MKQLTPLVTAALVLLGLAGFVAFNATRAHPGGAAAAPPATTSPAPVTTTSRVAALPDEVVYAGKADSSKLAVAVAVKGRRVAAYLCDGAREAWLTGSAKDGHIDVTSANRNAGLSASIEGDALTGTTKLGANEYRFTIGVAKKPAGLYRNKNGTTTIGWIVLPDGSQVGVANTNGQETPAPPLDAASGTATVGGGPVSVSPVSGEEEIG